MEGTVRDIFCICLTILHAFISKSKAFSDREWASSPVIKTSPPGSTVTLSCQLTAPGTVVWIVSEVIIGFDDLLHMSKDPQGFSLSKTQTGSELTIKNATHEDSGWYTCKAAGVRDQVHLVNIKNEPFLKVSCREKEAVLTWIVDATSKEYNIHPVKVQSSSTSTEDWQAVMDVPLNNAIAKVPLTGRNDKYRIQWTDAFGVTWTSTSPNVSCTSVEDVPIANPSDVHAYITKGDTNLTMTIYWTGIEDIYKMTPGFHYNVLIFEFQGEFYNETEIYDEDQFMYSATLPHVSATTAYIVSIRSYNIKGGCMVEPKKILVVYSPQDDDEGQVYPLPGFLTAPTYITAKVNSSVTFECEHEAEDDYPVMWGGPDSYYYMAIGSSLVRSLEKEAPNPGIIKRVKSTGKTLTINSLQKNDTGEFYCEVCMNPEMYLFHSLKVGSPVDITPVEVTCNTDQASATIRWGYCSGELKKERGHHGNGSESCQISPDFKLLKPYMYRVTAKSHSHSQSVEIYNETQTELQMDLHPGFTYFFGVQSFNIYGESEPRSSDISCKLNPKKPERNPAHVTVSRSSSSIAIFWENLEPQEENGQKFHYKITYKSGNSLKIAHSRRSPCEISDIDEDLVYIISVVSSNEMGDCEEMIKRVVSYPGRVEERIWEFASASNPMQTPEVILLNKPRMVLPCQTTDSSSVMWRSLPDGEILSINEVTISNHPHFSIQDGSLVIGETAELGDATFQCLVFKGTSITASVVQLQSLYY